MLSFIVSFSKMRHFYRETSLCNTVFHRIAARCLFYEKKGVAIDFLSKKCYDLPRKRAPPCVKHNTLQQ